MWGFSGGEFGGENSWFPLSCKDTRFESTGKFRSPFLGHAHSPIQQQQRHKFTFVINQEQQQERRRTSSAWSCCCCCCSIYNSMCVHSREKRLANIASQAEEPVPRPSGSSPTHSLTRPPTHLLLLPGSQPAPGQPASQWVIFIEWISRRREEGGGGGMLFWPPTHAFHPQLNSPPGSTSTSSPSQYLLYVRAFCEFIGQGEN